ncbi:triokinase/FMN cyclase-like isoform X2 [Cylas formicarius]|nr:triokinase/FMN cyclase-like isoform X2 [Cylas formicarius]
MLTASVQGSSSLPPSSKLILRVIRELSVNHNSGTLLIIPAISADHLNFGLAAERAINDNLRVLLLDCGDRSPANVVLVSKIAGSVSQSGGSLEDIYAFCRAVLDNMCSAVNKRPTIDNRECLYCENCKASNTGLADRDLKFVANDLFDAVDKKLSFKPNLSVVVLINNQNFLKKEREYAFIKEIGSIFQLRDVYVARYYIVNGFSGGGLTLTVLKIFDKEILTHLEAPCDVPGWIRVNQTTPHSISEILIRGRLRQKCRLSPPTKGPKLRIGAANVLLLCIQFASDALISCEKMLNKMDSERGAGDVGSRLKRVAEVLKRRIKDKKLILNCPFTLFLSLSKIFEDIVGGTMGTVYGVAFEGAAKIFGTHKEEDEVTALMWSEAFGHACESLRRFGKSGTMYEPFRAGSEAVKEGLAKGEKFIIAFGMGVGEAERSARDTRGDNRYPDPGAHAVGIWMRAVYEGLKLKCPD